jgi:acetyl-CoA carboxylase biotin carboxylase subunit
VSGNTREEALIRARNALNSFVIEGVPTTIDFLARVTEDPAFARGEVDTHFIERFLADSKSE